ncbi:Ribosomal L1 domain containing 1 [Nesidiocoris tenuis]|uniref:Ribosomal L1 domain containing 1 n=1 Tax=Nesidiocoris tenuis TaxID=355587 RepID=A0ABN7BC53_9HEMI|nr:Ribosomal L1 domain containing 1 [Nesidiocoris tenuis]
MKTKPLAPKGEKKTLDKPRGGKIQKNKQTGPVKLKSDKIKMSIQSGDHDLAALAKKKLKLSNGSAKAPNSPDLKKKIPKKGSVDGVAASKVIESEIQKRFGPKGGNENGQSPEASGKKRKNRRKRKCSGSSSGTPVTTESGPATPVKSNGETPQKIGKNKKKKMKRALEQQEGLTQKNGPAQKPTVKKRKQAKEPAQLKAKIEDEPIAMGSFPARTTVEKALNALLTEVNRSGKPKLLGEDSQIMLEVQLFKVPKGAKHVQRILLPNRHLHEDADVVFISTDVKKGKTDDDFEESIDFHKDLLEKSGIKKLPTIIPFQKLVKEYTQFEEKRKFINSYDVFLLDAKLSHRWPGVIRKKIAHTKAPIPVRVNETLKRNVDVALRKTTVIINNNTSTICPVVGHTKMPVNSLVDNIVTVATVLCDETRFPTGKANIRKLSVKTPKSEQGFVIYVSIASPNSVVMPTPKKEKVSPVVGEVSTAGVTVAVHPSGRVHIKSVDKDLNETENNSSPVKKKGKVVEEDSGDEDLSELDSDEELDSSTLEKFKKANQASDESEDDDDDEEEIEKAEREFLKALREQQDAIEAKAKQNKSKIKANKKTKKGPIEANDSEEEDDEEEDDFEIEDEDLDDEGESDDEEMEDDSDDDDVPTLVPAKKSKAQGKGASQQQQKQSKALQVKGKQQQQQQSKQKQQQPKQQQQQKQQQPKQQQQQPKQQGGKKGKQNGTQKQAGHQTLPKNQKGSKTKKGSPRQMKAGKFTKKAGGGKK